MDAPALRALGAPVRDDDRAFKTVESGCQQPSLAAIQDGDPPSKSGTRWWIVAGAVPMVAIIGLLTVLVLRAPAAPTVVVESEASAPAPAIPSPPPGIDGYAELYVSTYLTQLGAGSEDALDGFVAGVGDVAAMTPARFYVTAAKAVAVEPIDEGYWSITVAADVLSFVEGEYVPLGIQTFATAIASDSSGFVATALPARIGSPPDAQVPPGVEPLRTPAGANVTAFIQDVLGAMLAGIGELPRYLAAGISIAPLDDPYASVQVVDARAGTVGDSTFVQARALAIDDLGSSHLLDYTFEVSDTAGVWEVLALIPGAPPGVRSEVE